MEQNATHSQATCRAPWTRSTRTTRPTRAVGRSAVVIIAAFAGVAGCSEESRDSIEDDLRSAATDVEEEVRSVVTEVADLADETARDAVELAARNVASAQGAEAFESAGHPIDGDLSCTADVDGDLTELTISCEGTTEDGGAAELTGSTSELPGASLVELEGSFTGTVDGDEVFSTENLGG